MTSPGPDIELALRRVRNVPPTSVHSTFSLPYRQGKVVARNVQDGYDFHEVLIDHHEQGSPLAIGAFYGNFKRNIYPMSINGFVIGSSCNALMASGRLSE